MISKIVEAECIETYMRTAKVEKAKKITQKRKKNKTGYSTGPVSLPPLASDPVDKGSPYRSPFLCRKNKKEAFRPFLYAVKV